MYVNCGRRKKKSNERVNGLDSALSVFLPNSRFSFLLDNFSFSFICIMMPIISYIVCSYN